MIKKLLLSFSKIKKEDRIETWRSVLRPINRRLSLDRVVFFLISWKGKAFSYKINNFLSFKWSISPLQRRSFERKLNFVRENALSGHKVKRLKKKSIKVCSFSFPLWSTHWFLFRSLNWPLNLHFPSFLSLWPHILFFLFFYKSAAM